MRRIFLACVAVLACGAANAVPRGDAVEIVPLTPEEREAQRLQMEQDIAAWLLRLVGRFNFEGIADTRGEAGPPPPTSYADAPPADNSLQGVYYAKGKGDCIPVGAGPGVQCVFNVAWDVTWDENGRIITGRDPSQPPAAVLMGAKPFLAPSVALFGFNPNASKINYLMLDSGGLAEAESGVLDGITAKWTREFACENSTDRCRRLFRIRAKPDARILQMSIDDEVLSEGRWALYGSYTFDMRRVPQEEAGEVAHDPAGK